ncbi:hypothetical protein [Nitrosomonas mobilis]|uniref:Uncharacterized protein n=1 Tax=Nitrosomonas mobilis TaxID=51642 RepID=A0A1G5SH00_9PROT|nr:hypothetical protein [Nitrosomonas mobilis]SCZ86388.1 hypothetical protein NSMM_520058 [Nitrosomonas mobilis]
MFGLFKKQSPPEELVDKLRPHYAQVVSLVNTIDGPFSKLYEAGIFVSSVATSKILTFQKVDPPAFADEFNAMWVKYLIGSYSVDGKSPSKNVVVSRLQEEFPVYRELFFDTIDPSHKEKAHDNAVTLMMVLFRNCTGKQSPEGKGNFLNLMLASSQLVGIGSRILKEINE